MFSIDANLCPYAIISFSLDNLIILCGFNKHMYSRVHVYTEIRGTMPFLKHLVSPSVCHALTATNDERKETKNITATLFNS